MTDRPRCDIKTYDLGDGTYGHTCQVCGRPVENRSPRWHRLCRPEGKKPPPRRPVKQSAPCVHRGPEIGQEECQTCAGKTRIKVFACELHVACTLGKALAGRACCKSCQDFMAILPEKHPHT